MTSNQHRAWADIQRDYKMTDADGKRLVMFNQNGGTVLGPWHGPHCTECNRPKLPAGFFVVGGVLDRLAYASAEGDRAAYRAALADAQRQGRTSEQIEDAHRYGWQKAQRFGYCNGAPAFDWLGR